MTNELPDYVKQRNTILNLYNSGIDPEIISLELDLEKDVVEGVIKNEEVKKLNDSQKHSNNLFLNKFYLDAVIDVDKIIKDTQFRIWNALKTKPEFSISFSDTQNILEKYAESKVNLVILHVDLVGSTKLSLSLPIDRLTTIIRSFAQEMSTIICLYGGYVLKYIGDAVLAFFVIEDSIDDEAYEDKDILVDDNNNFSLLQYVNAISCASTMIKLIREGINPILNQYDYPELKVRVGIDWGEVAVVQYGLDIYEFKKIVLKRPHLDLVGHTISVAVKMTSLARSDHVVIGQKLFNKLDTTHKKSFKQLVTDPELWNYQNGDNGGGSYNLYETI